MNQKLYELYVKANGGQEHGCQKNLANLIGLSSTSVRRWLRRSPNPPVKFHQKLAEVFGITIEALRAAINDGGEGSEKSFVVSAPAQRVSHPQTILEFTIPPGAKKVRIVIE